MTKEPMVHTHGFHIHHYGDLSKSCDSLGGHFNPVGVNHGSRKSKHRYHTCIKICKKKLTAIENCQDHCMHTEKYCTKQLY